jgi:hypothetical protein
VPFLIFCVKSDSYPRQSAVRVVFGSPGPSRRKTLTYFGSGYAFASLERADGLVNSCALLGCQDVGVLGFKLRQEFKNSSTFLWRQFQELRKRRQNAPVARVENVQSHGITPVIKGPLFVFLSVLFVFSAFAKPPARQVFAAIPVDCDTVKM